MNSEVPFRGPAAERASRFSWMPWAVVLLTLLVWGTALTAVNLRLRGILREQIAGRDASVLGALAQVQDPAVGRGAGGEEWGWGALTGDAQVDALIRSEQLRELVGRLKGIIGARSFDSHGELIIGLPLELLDAPLASPDLLELKQGRTITRYHPHLSLETLFPVSHATRPPSSAALPVLEVVLPLKSEGGLEVIGMTQLWLDGSGIAAEYALLDRRLLQQGLVVFLLGSLVVGGALVWAFRRLQRANQLLAARTADLLRANDELALAAKTSAVGALTAHLIHGLKNPLQGLHQFVSHRGSGSASDGEVAWAEAANSTRRMQAIVQEIVRVLREENDATQYEVTCVEVLEMLGSRAAAAARAAGVTLRTEGSAPGELSNREANLVLLILDNLVTNAIQATPAGKSVTVRLEAADGAVTFEVIDQGIGLPPSALSNLFAPQRSTKPGGTGIGLAISRQLAQHLGADLALRRSSSDGSVFAFRLPCRPGAGRADERSTHQSGAELRG